MYIQDILRKLGITCNYRGYKNTVLAVNLIVSNMDRLEAVTKEVYYEVARQCGCKWSSVERNIRTVVQRVWRINPKMLIDMAGYPMTEPPTVSEFLEIISNYIVRTEDSMNIDYEINNIPVLRTK